MQTISIVIPLFNEEENLDTLFKRVGKVVANPMVDWEIVLVDDGSSDQTNVLCRELLPRFRDGRLLTLSRNFGQQAAYRAGLDHCRGDAVVFLDADLQDPPELIPEMIQKWQSGKKLVVGCRKSRAETGVKKLLFNGFHEIFFKLTGGVMPKNSGTFALMDRVIVDHMKEMPELNMFLPAMRSWVGYPQDVVWYDRTAREGAAKQTFAKLFGYAWDGITSFSDAPLKWISISGFCISFLGFLYGIWLVALRILQLMGYFHSLNVLGFTTVAVAIFFVGGVQLLSLGIIGEYVARIYRETKRRPPYLIQDNIASVSKR